MTAAFVTLLALGVYSLWWLPPDPAVVSVDLVGGVGGSGEGVAPPDGELALDVKADRLGHDALGPAGPIPARREIDASNLLVKTWLGRGDPPELEPLGEVGFVLEVVARSITPVPDEYVYRFEGRTQRNGEARLEVPEDILERVCGSGFLRLQGEIRERGYSRTSVLLPRRSSLEPEERDGPAVLELHCSVGTTISGRVQFEGEGRAYVSARLEGGLESEARLIAVDRRTGEFDLYVPWVEGRVDVVARVQGVGTSSRRGIPLSPERPPDPIEFLIAPGEELRGVLVDSEGRGVGGKKLFAVHVDIESGVGEPTQLTEAEMGVALDGLGCGIGWTEANFKGHFKFTGLRPGAYVVRAKAGRSSDYPWVVTERPIETGPEIHELRFPAPALFLSILKPNGKPYLSRPSFLFEMGEVSEVGGPVSSREWPDSLLVGVLPIQKGFGGGLSMEAKYLGSGRYRIELEPGVDYDVGILGAGIPWTSRVVSSPRLGESVEVTLALEEPRPTGTLEVSARASDGEPLAGPFKIHVEDPARGWKLRQVHSEDVDAWPFEIEVPPGEYRVRVEGAADIAYGEFAVRSPRTSGGFTTSCRVRSGSRTEVSATLGQGARVRVKSIGRPSAPLRKDGKGQARESIQDTAEDWVVLDLHRRGELPVRLEFIDWASGEVGVDMFLYENATLGEAWTSELVTAGNYRLVGRLRDGRTASRDIELVDGRTTEVELNFR